MDAPALFEELTPLPFEEQKARIGSDPCFTTWGLAELLCKLSEKEAPDRPERARELAALAVEVSFSLREWQPVEQHWLDELRAFTLAHLGNALRVLGSLTEAREAFTEAERLWRPAEANMGDVMGYEARYLALQASLRRAERSFPEALRLLDAALAADPDPSLRARIWINKARVFEELGRIDEAIDILAEAKREAGPNLDDRLRLCFVQNHLDYLSKAGRFIEAEIVLSEVKPLTQQLGGEIDLLRLRWTEARIEKSLGRVEEALHAFEEVRKGFAGREFFFDAALVSLEYALVLATLGRSEEVVRVVNEALPILGSLKVEREGLMAIQLLSEAARTQRLSAELIANVLDGLRRVVPDPLSGVPTA
jgi:tetratricopeptide (TPR) repeat protein